MDVQTIWPHVETKHEIDSGMMPPPISTQMPMNVRRPSLPTATPLMISDKQLLHMKAAAAEALKTELMDETSQGSLAETSLHSPEVAVAAQFHAHYKPHPPQLFESNSMPAFPITPMPPAAPIHMEVDAMTSAVEMAVKNELTQELQHHHHQQQQQQLVQQQQQQQLVQQQQQQAAAVTAVVDEIISAAVVNNVPSATTAAAIETALSDILQHAGVSSPQQTAAAAAVLGRSLSLNSNLSSTSSSPQSNSPHSAELGPTPMAQELMLNSTTGATLNILPMPALLTPLTDSTTGTVVSTNANGTEVVSDSVTVATAAAAAAAAAAANANGLSTDIIMNPAVSPSTVLSSSNGVATAVVSNIMSPHQVTMANSILNDIAMQVEPTQEDAAVAALALSNIMMSPTTGTNGVNAGDVSAPVTAVGQADVTTATSTAVSNLIIKAAADLISNQEQQQQQQQQQHQQQQHHQQTQQNVQAQQQQTAAQTTNPLMNLILSHADVPNGQSNAVADVNATYPLAIPPVAATTQESPLIVALATDSGLQKSVAAAAVTAKGSVVTQQTTTTTSSIMPATVGVLATATVPIPPPIPQELTTMSDQDLLSYINPSTFDQI